MQPLNMNNENTIFESQTVTQFYYNRVVLVTGPTGFLGRVLTEKLLRDFNVKKIFLLIRKKNNLTANERLSKIFEETLFDRVRNIDENVFMKVQAIEVDYHAEHLGLDNYVRHMLIDEVEIVFNVMASIKFNEKLREAVTTNVLATKKILDLVLQMKNIQSFVHTSTLYSNCDSPCIKEAVCPLDMDYKKLFQIIRILDDNILDKIQHWFIGDLPNTYTMTKRCAEDMVNNLMKILPAGIFRPPIVLSTYKEPVPGWTDNLNGPSGLCAWTVKGFIHVIWGDKSKKANLVPVDYCINAMLASAWDINRKFKNRITDQCDVPVYNYIYDENNITWGRYMEMVPLGFHTPFKHIMWYYSYNIHRFKFMYKLSAFIFHMIPACILDLLAVLRGKKKKFRKAYLKADQVIEMMSFFGLREWNYENDNIKALYKDLDGDDRVKLEFNLQTIDWKEYFATYIPGIKKYYLKEDCTEEEVKKCRKNSLRMRMLHQMLKRFFYLIFFCKTTKMVWDFLRYLVSI